MGNMNSDNICQQDEQKGNIFTPLGQSIENLQRGRGAGIGTGWWMKRKHETKETGKKTG